jgi:AraC-like DNA-binding protein
MSEKSFKSYIRYLECEGLKIAASVEVDNNCGEHSIYHSPATLLYVQKGTLNIAADNVKYSITAGNFCLTRKHTFGVFHKTWTAAEGSFKMLAFMLEDSFVKDVIGNITLPENPAVLNQRMYILPHSSILTGLMHSIGAYFDEGEVIDNNLIRLKTLESIIGILKASPGLAGVFFEFSKDVRADLKLFMENNYMQKYKLDEFASMSGRSISTFNREFRRLFNKSPHQWIKEKRLDFARNLLLQSDLSPSDIYVQAGFEDLAHFSRSFKGHFGINPSRAKEILR